MADGRQRADWGRTALLAALIAEPNRDRENRATPFTPADFNPYLKPAAAEEKETVIDMGTDLSALKAVFIDRGS